MAVPAQPSRSALCIGDPDAFASEMIKMINDKEFRLQETSITRQKDINKLPFMHGATGHETNKVKMVIAYLNGERI